MTYTIEQIRDNFDLKDNKNPSYGTFDVLVRYDGYTKWISIPYELYISYIEDMDLHLRNYLDKNELFEIDEILVDLYEIGFQFDDSILKYITFHYPTTEFHLIDEYNPNQKDDEEYI